MEAEGNDEEAMTLQGQEVFGKTLAKRVKTMSRLLGIDGSGVLVVIFLEASFEGPFPFNISPDDRPLCGGAYDFHKMTTLAGVSEGKRIHLFLALFLSNPGADAG
uniref:Uncharacterized protein n=1 Tax=Oryza barthii TaxID=65489 RepID=A0A0D3HE54_9ORYZ